jgi:hypothetical protein
MSEYTPLPWKAMPNEFCMVSGNGRKVCNFPSAVSLEHEANAELIVRACNSHEAMVEACRAVVDRLDYLTVTWGQGGIPKSLVDQVKAALALATKEDPS